MAEVVAPVWASAHPFAGGEMGTRVRAHDWGATPLGPIDAWQHSLRAATQLALDSPFPTVVAWGPDLTCIYNDAYRSLLGEKSDALGHPFVDVLSAATSAIGPIIKRALAGEASFHTSLRFALLRGGVPEEAWFDVTFSPLRDDNGVVRGFLGQCVETTQRVSAENRQRFRIELGDALRALSDPAQITAQSARILCEYVRASRVHYAEVEADGEHAVVPADYAPNVQNRAGRYRLADFPALVAESRVDRAFVAAEIATDPRIGTAEQARFAALPAAAIAAVPLFKNGVLAAILAVHHAEPHAWTSDEVALVQDTADRIWDAIERARAEAALRESEARFRLMIDAVPQIVWIADASGQMEFFNKQFSLYTGAPFSPMMPADVAAGFMHPDDGPAVVSGFEAALASGNSFHIEHRIRDAAGDYRWFHVRAEPYREPAKGEIVRWYGASVDIHARKLAETALSELNADLERKVTERSLGRSRTWRLTPDIMGVLNADGYFEQSNPAWEATLGWTEDEMARTPLSSLIHPDDLVRTRLGFNDLLTHGLPAIRFENRYRHKNGCYRWLSWVAVPEDGKAYCSARDITQEKARAADLLLHENIVQSHQSPVVAFDRAYRRIAFNKAHSDAFHHAFNHWPAIGDDLLALFPPDQKAALHSAMDRVLGGESFMITEEYGDAVIGETFFEVSYFPLRDAAGRITAAFRIAKDITARERAEADLAASQEALRQSQKMEALGSLTGGVAHDFNNLLTPIFGSLDLLQRRGLGGEREQRLIAGAMQSAERAKTLVQRLLTFARRQPLKAVPVDIAKLLTGMGDLISSTTGPRIKVLIEASDDLPAAQADPNQVEMAVLNLTLNARDAMQEGGALHISASAETVMFGHRSKLLPGTYLRLSVADTGAGMDAATLVCAIEPFFSTKGVGKGTGLGLSMVHGLASQLGGALTIQSRSGVGTTVELWLPLSPAVSETVEVAPEFISESEQRGTVLLVDDEELVRMSTADMLNDLGYTVLEAASAEEAMKLVADGEAFDLLVTDHLMPGMNGTELACAIRSVRPDLPVLLVSGFSGLDAISPDFTRLTKPFRRDDLALSLAQLSTPS